MSSTEQNIENHKIGAGTNDNISTSHSTNNGINRTESKETNEKLENYDNLEKHETPDNEEQIPTADEILDKLPGMPERSTKDQLSSIVLCFFIAFGGFIFGFDTGTISGFTNMPDYINRFGLQDADGNSKTYKIGLIVAIFNVGCAFGCIFLSKIADVYGRRIGLMFAMVVYIVGIIIQISALHSWIQIVFGRLIAGFAVGTVSVLSPLFIGETSPKAYRGTLVCCFQLCVTFGIFIGYCINYGTYHNFSDSRQWRITLGYIVNTGTGFAM
mmetsp:Transcript_6446/g.8072  ORF Transcript_6446/g.8072 Transcript_6446/m.8072 type:complete len:271 (-) Transcript_6446:1864-2676(-)